MKNLILVIMVSSVSLGAFAQDKQFIKESSQINTESEDRQTAQEAHLDLIESKRGRLNFFMKKSLLLPRLSHL